MSAERIVQINAPHFCAALVLTRHGAGPVFRVDRAAPILSWTVGWREDDLVAYFDRKGWKVEEVETQ